MRQSLGRSFVALNTSGPVFARTVNSPFIGGQMHRFSVLASAQMQQHQWTSTDVMNRARCCESHSAASFVVRSFSTTKEEDDVEPNQEEPEEQPEQEGGTGGARAKKWYGPPPPASSLTPRWESGEVRLLKPRYRIGARRIKLLKQKAERQGYVIVEQKKRVRETPAIQWTVREPKGHKWEALLEKRRADIEKALKKQEKMYEKHKKKLRDNRRSERQKGVAMLFKKRGEVGKPVRKGPRTRAKLRRAIGEG